MPGPGYQIADVLGRLQRGQMTMEEGSDFVSVFRESLDQWQTSLDNQDLPTQATQEDEGLKEHAGLALEALDGSLEALEDWLETHDFDQMKRCLELASLAQRLLVRLQHDANDAVEALLDENWKD